MIFLFKKRTLLFRTVDPYECPLPPSVPSSAGNQLDMILPLNSLGISSTVKSFRLRMANALLPGLLIRGLVRFDSLSEIVLTKSSGKVSSLSFGHVERGLY